MKRSIITFVLFSLLISSCSLFHDKKDPYAGQEMWVSVYLASWKHNVRGTVNGKTWGNLFTDQIDWSAFTHMFYFSLMPQSDGTIPDIVDYANVNPDRVRDIVRAAHENNKPILITIGGDDSRTGYLAAMQDSNRTAFIDSIITLIDRWGFDGVDISIEPLRTEDEPLLTPFINELHDKLMAESTRLLPRPLLTISVESVPEILVPIQDKFDQINLTTYNMSRPFQGWVAWHNTPLYNRGYTFPLNPGVPLPSIEDMVDDFINAGIERSKIGIAASFYGYEWTGVNSPRQGWEAGSPPTIPWFGGTPYHDLADSYNMSNARWDDDAKVPYLSLQEPDRFVSFDNELSIQEKSLFIRREGLGGLLVWELAGGWMDTTETVGNDPLLQSVKKELNRYK